jgi:small subunit ribosomal protein S17
VSMPLRESHRKTRVGRVVKNKMNKTIVVEVERTLQHPLYGKTIRLRSRLYAHDEANAAGMGDKVRIMETRPLSKLKRWRLMEIVEKAPAA